MRAWQRFGLGLAFATIAGVIGEPARAAPIEVIVNGGFETGTMAGWTTGFTPSANATLCCDNRFATGTGASATGIPGSILTRIAGQFSAFGDFDGGILIAGRPQYQDDVHIFMKQSFAKAGPLSAATLSFDFRVEGGQFTGGTIGRPEYGGHVDPREFNVLVSDGTTSLEVYSYEVPDWSVGTRPLEHVSLDITAALNSLSDGPITLTFDRFVPQFFTGGAYFVGDNFSLLVTAVEPVPEPAALALLGAGLIGLSRCRRRKIAA
ncbi:MAG TPA: PEP-CTERM sorting domain-containing protein [Alphaproteobacteria bacterium]|nr:PEP-CTERM sorting domain-containing protein [Alphaproteobacteria bacterium]